MPGSLITRPLIDEFLVRIDREFALDGTVFLVGETSQVQEGWRRWTDRIELCSKVRATDRPRFNECLVSAAKAMDVAVTDECPGEVVPLPDGHDDRSRPVSQAPDTRLALRHFDPYSVAIRLIARGDEPDYHLALAYLEHEWILVDEMDRLLEGLLPRFTMETIQQDPAEFRRRYGGLLQMAGTISAGVTHRNTPV